jgi:hypothetical protein
MQAVKQSIEKAKPKQKPHQRSASEKRLRQTRNPLSSVLIAIAEKKLSR